MGIATPSESDARIEPKTILVSLGCLFGALYSSYLLYHDIRDRGTRTGVQMAKLERAEAKVRLKPASSFVWGGAGAHEDLYLKDSVQTAPRGGASIRFNDGTLLELGENSLIIIDSIENLSLSFLHGSVVVRSQAGDSRVTLGQDGKAVFENLPVSLIQPEPLAEFFTAEKKAKALSFEWGMNSKTNQAASNQVAVQVSTNPGFRGEGVQSFEVPKDQHKISADIFPGKYYWRVVSDGHSLSEPSQFRVDGAVSLKPLFPNSAQKISLFGGTSSVQFRWIPASSELPELEGESKVAHEIQVSNDPTFKKTFRTQTIASTSGSSLLKGIPVGEHYWRIVSKYPDLSVNSPVEKFQLDQAADVSAESNQLFSLRYPTSKQEIHYWTELPEFVFKWSKDEKARSYLVEVARDPEFKEISSAESQSEELPSRAVQLKPGLQYWRVKAMDGAKHVLEVSRIDQFEYGPFPVLRAPASAQPASGSVINPMETEKNPLASWTPVENAESYEFTVKQGGKIIHQEMVKETQAEFKELGPGQFQFSVRAIDQLQRKGEPLPDHAFEITFGSPLAAPEALSPEVQ